MLTAGLAIMATLLTIARGWPQTSRIAIHRNTSGVSSLTWTLMLAVHVAWVVWTAHLAVIPVLLANVLAAASCVAVLVTMSRHSRLSYWRSLWTAALSTLLSVALLDMGGSVLLSVGVTSVTSVTLVPQVLQVYRGNASGVSPMTWWLAVASAVIWPTYYMLIDRPLLIAPNVSILFCALMILGRLYFVRRLQPVADMAAGTASVDSLIRRV